jgi:hypothetical protein
MGNSSAPASSGATTDSKAQVPVTQEAALAALCTIARDHQSANPATLARQFRLSARKAARGQDLDCEDGDDHILSETGLAVPQRVATNDQQERMAA